MCRHRLLPTYREAPAEALLLIGLIEHLYKTPIVHRPVTGRPNAAPRATFETPLRKRARAFAVLHGMPMRRGDTMARRLVELSVLRAEPIAQGTAWRFQFKSSTDAIRALELAYGVKLVDWSMGPIPD